MGDRYLMFIAVNNVDKLKFTKEIHRVEAFLSR